MRLHLLKLVGNHGKGFEDCVGGPGDGDDALRTVALRDVDASTALVKGEKTSHTTEDVLRATH